MARKKPVLLTLKKVADGSDLRSMLPPERVDQGQVLPHPQPAETSRDATGGVFAVPSDPTDPVPAAPGNRLDDAELNLTVLLRQILMEDAAEEFQEKYVGQGRMKNLEILARGLVQDALNGDKNTRELVIDRIEGKAVRAAQVQPPDTTLEDQLDRASVAALNELAEQKDESP